MTRISPITRNGEADAKDVDGMNEPTQSECIESIRKRPSMFIGGIGFFGFIQYLVSAFDVMLQHHPTWIEIEFGKQIRLASDANIPLTINENGFVDLFEVYRKSEDRYLYDAAILTALSYELRLTACDGTNETRISWESGSRVFHEQRPAMNPTVGTTFEFHPDFGIFSVNEVSPAVVHSYCRRTSCLYPGMSFRVKMAGEVTEYKSNLGIREFFDAVVTPYQILHSPIHFHERDDELVVEGVFAFQSWSENRIWSFANKGRVPDGGTHEAGFLDAIARMHNNMQSLDCTGLLAVLAIEYPGIAYKGCLKSRIGNPELRDRVCELATIGLRSWVRNNEAEMVFLKKIERFQFADIW